MKNTKRRLEPLSFYDHTGIAAHLTKMAEKGWMLESISSTGWLYRRAAPRKLTYAVTYYPRASEFDPEPTEGQQIYQEYSALSGWQFVCSSAQMQIFCSEQENPVPIETDPALEVETIHKAAKKSFLLIYFILLGSAILNGGLFISRLLGDPIGLLASAANLFTGSIWAMLILLCAVELIAYYHWRSKARKAALRGEFLDTPNHSLLQKIILGATVIGFVYWLINVMMVGSVLMRWVSILMLGYMIALVLIVNGVKQFLKRKKVSRGKNFALTMIVDFVLAFAMMGAITYGTLYASRNGMFTDAETYEHHGSTFILHQDEIPLMVEDMLDVEYDGYVRQRSVDESVFLGVLDARQWPRFDDETGKDIPDLEYNVTIIKAEFLYELCKEQLMSSKDETSDPNVPEGFKRVYVAVDPAPWGAVEAYQLAYQDTGAMEKYLLCYEASIVEINFDWEPTSEHKAIVGEKLGAK